MPSIASRCGLLALALTVAACGGGDRGSPAEGTVMRSVQGAVVKGPLAGATVSFFHVDGAGHPTGAAIGTATTDSQGHVTTGLPSVAEPILAVTSGGSYVDEADDAGGDDRRRITLAADQHFEAIVPANADTFVLTPYSMAVLLRARRLAQGVNFAAVYQAVLQQAVEVLGFDPTAVIPADPLAPDAGGDPKYGLILGGAAYAIGTMATNLGVAPSYPIVRAFIDDLSDGRLDGKLGDSALQLKVQSIGDVDLNGEILRFRNNHFGLYGNLLAQIDEDLWSVDPPIPQVFPPVAASDAIEVAEGGTASTLVGGATSVLANDDDPQDAPLTAILVTPPAHGQLVLSANGTFSYVHDGSETVTDQFTYKANNGARDSPPATVSITITPVNQAPLATDDRYIGHQGQILTITPPGVLFNDTDADGDTLTAQLVDPPSHGTLTLAPQGGFSFTPAAAFAGDDAFTYRAIDGHGGQSELATVTLAIVPAEAPPVANDDSYRVAMNGRLEVSAPGVLGNDSGTGPLTAVLDTSPVGTLLLLDDGSFSYEPPPGFSGTTHFQYHATSASGDSDAATVQILVQQGTTPGNHAPVGVNDSFTWTGATLHGNVLANDFDSDGDALAAQLVAAPSFGTLTLNADGSFDYDFSGCGGAKRAGKVLCQDQFSYRVSDGQATSGVVSVTIDIAPANQPPSGLADSFGVDAGGTLTIAAPGVLGNDSDPDGDPITAELVSDVGLGTLTLGADGSFSYENTAAGAQDQFTYRVSDGTLTSAVVTVTIAINRAPTAADDSYTVNAGGSIDVPAPGLMANDSDPDGDAITVDPVPDASPTQGTVTLNADGSFHYQHTPPVSKAAIGADDQFSYHVTDGSLESNSATVTIHVNHLPFGLPDSYVVNQGGTLDVAAPGVLGNDGDSDADALTAVKVSDPTLGTLTLDADGSFHYVNTVDGAEDQFSYRVDDGSAQSAVITVTITINHPPIGAADDYSPTPGRVLVDGAPGVLGNDGPDPDGDPLTAVLESAPTKGTLNFSADGSFLYQPFSGVGFGDTDQFTYRVSDGQAQSAPITVTLDYFLCDCSFPQGRHGAVLTHDGQTVVFLASDQALDPTKPDDDTVNIFVTTFNGGLDKAAHAKVSVDGGTTIRLHGPDAGPNDGDPTTGVEPNGDVTSVNVTPDGHYVVFTTFATNYGPTLPTFSSQVYRYTLFDDPTDPGDTAGEIVLVSSRDGAPAPGNSFSNFGNAISDNGQFVAFESRSTDLTPFTIDTVNAPQQVYLRDITNTETTLVSVDACGGAPGDRSASVSSMSFDGSLISFESDADDLTGCIILKAGAKALTNVQTFVRDVGAGTTTMVSVDGLGNPGTGDSSASRLSPDGTLIAIETTARNLVAGDTVADGSLSEIFLHNLSNPDLPLAVGENLRVSRAFDGTDPDGSSSLGLNPFSEGNDFLIFASQATNLVDAGSDTNNVQDIFVYRLGSDGMTRVDVVSFLGEQALDGSSNQRGTMARDGNALAYDSNSINFADPTGEQQVYVRDILSVVPKSLQRPTPGR